MSPVSADISADVYSIGIGKIKIKKNNVRHMPGKDGSEFRMIPGQDHIIPPRQYIRQGLPDQGIIIKHQN